MTTRLELIPEMIMKPSYLAILFVLLALLVGGCAPQPPARAQAEYDLAFTLKTTLKDGKMVFVGAGGAIDGLTNPDLSVQVGDTVLVTVLNDDGIPHDFSILELGVQSTLVSVKGQTSETVFEARESSEYAYYCTVAGHRQMGMEGKLVVKSGEK